MATTKLWRYSATLGEWMLERVVTPATAWVYLETARHEDPTTPWCVADRKPRGAVANP